MPAIRRGQAASSSPVNAAHRDAYAPCAASRSSWVPDSTMRPPSTTMIRSARAAVVSRCATTMVVRLAVSRSVASVTAASVARSRAAVASSRSRMSGSTRYARARAISWRWPADRLRPRSDISWLKSPVSRVPVIAGQRRKLDGVIHGASSSGHTLFVEPLETIDLNNELVRLGEEEAREVHRILLEMTDRLRGHADSIRQTLVVMAELDLIFAKARFAIEFDCAIPRFGERLLLREARHPLLEDVLRRRQRKSVPVSLDLERERRTLLISGPNTGGKTVALKTVGDRKST